jgi:hypothetical protein
LNFARKIKQRYRDGLILNSIYDSLKQKIFEVNLFYLFQEETFSETDLLEIQPKIEPVEVEHLKPSDMKHLAVKAERDYSEDKMVKMLSADGKCMGIKYKDEVVSYGWYNLKNCNNNPFSFSYDLKESEAYAYGIRTLSAFKGKALAPYLRNHMHKHLAQIGRTKLYSLLLFSNIPSIKFHRKLNAKPLKLFMNVKYLRKYNRNILLKRYRN